MREPLRNSNDARAAEALVLAAHSLAETYAVLTRLPGPNRLRSRDAIALLEANWRETPVVHLTAAVFRAHVHSSAIADTTSSWVGWRPLAALEYTSRPSATTSNRPPPDGIISMSTPRNRFLSVAAKLTALGS